MIPSFPKFKNFILFLIITFSLTQCKKEDDSTSTDPAFTKYISAFTSGVIGNSGEIRIRFAKALPKDQLNQALDKDLFSFDPEIEGETYWSDNQTLVFKPKEPLFPGKEYKGSFKLNKLMDVPKNLNIFPFKFRVTDQSVEVVFYGMDPVSQNDLKWLRLKGNLYTGDRADGELIEKVTEAFQNNKKLTIHWQHGPEGKNHHFTIDSVQRKKSKGEIILSWKGKELGARDNGEKTFSIPPLGEFRVLDIRVQQEPEQMISIFFSDLP